MAFFDEIGKKISQTGQGAVKQTKMMANVAKLKSDITDYEIKIKGMYEQIGQKYYEDNRDNAKSPYLEGLNMVKGYQQQIEQLQQQIQEERVMAAGPGQASGQCPNCGATVNEDQIFCTVCGTKIK